MPNKDGDHYIENLIPSTMIRGQYLSCACILTHLNCSRHGFTYIRGWMQMVLAPNDLFSWNNNTMRHNSCNWYATLLPTDAQWHLLCAWSFLEAVMEPSSLFSDILLCLLSSPVRTQLMLIVPCWGPGAPHPQSGIPSPRVRAHSLSRVQNINCCWTLSCRAEILRSIVWPLTSYENSSAFKVMQL